MITGQLAPGCAQLNLRGLPDEDALALWRGMGVTGTRSELLALFRSFESHPLLLRALAAEVAACRRAQGDYGKWRALNPDFDYAGLDLKQTHYHILHFALRGLSTEEKRVLNTIVARRAPSAHDVLDAVLVGEEKTFADQAELDRTLRGLEDRGLIGWDREVNRYDAHPIVRGVAWDRMSTADETEIHEGLSQYFEPIKVPNQYNVESIADLAPAIAHYEALIHLGQFDDAVQIFRDRIDDATHFRLAAHQERIALLEPLFPQGAEGDIPLSTPHDQSYALNALALSYKNSGQPGRAILLYWRAAQIDETEGEIRHQPIYLGNMVEAMIPAGQFAEVDRALRRALQLTRANKDELKESIRLHTIGQLTTLTGECGLAALALARSGLYWHNTNNDQWLSVVAADQSQLHGFQGEFRPAQDWADHAWRLAETEKVARDFMRASLAQGRAGLGLDDLTTAEERLLYCLNFARETGVVESELPALIALGELALKKKEPDTARKYLNDVWDMAAAAPYPIQLADAHNLLARIEMSEGNKDAAIAAATAAYKQAWCDGPPFAYHWGLEAAKRLLDEWGAPHPDMPAFDDRDHTPLTAAEINPKDNLWVDPDRIDALFTIPKDD